MFFYLSKILWFFADPGNLLLIALCLGALLMASPWQRIGRNLVYAAAVFALLVAVLPVGQAMFIALENRFPVAQEPPSRVDGIVVLGGVVEQVVSVKRGQLAIGGAAERITELATLVRLYPNSKIVFTGGSGNLLFPDIKEADVIQPLLDVLGLPPGRVAMENRSRNTHENALFTKELAEPKQGETWMLVTSAFHMPRAVGSFRKAGWQIVPYPVDFRTRGDEHFAPHFNLLGGLSSLSGALHEWLGLTFYYLSGKTDALFPGPDT